MTDKVRRQEVSSGQSLIVVDSIGIKHGYSGLMQFGPDRPMAEGRDYIRFDPSEL